ncbi:MAG: hypothetical protein RIR26_2318 [Pseudomonadota bacterium]|jgi:hypothetical protein
MPLWLRITLLSVVGFSLGFAGIHVFLNGKENSIEQAQANDNPVDVDWATLRELDISTGKAPQNLKKLDGQKVRIPGFIVPLEDNQDSVSEFLLVPSPTACIHTPPPPANQMVHVRMAGGRKATRSFGPIWAKGRLRITDVDGPYGKSSYELNGELTEPYQ